jgi:uncharacterized membrane protein YedE/YeeE
VVAIHRIVIPLALATAIALAARTVADLEGYGRDPALTLWLGFLFGVFLQRSRFCFFCRLRELFEERDARGVLGILAALAIGLIGYTVIAGAWIVDPTAGHLPPEAHIGPASWVVAVAGLVFGIGMTLAGSCISAQLYRLGEGSLLSVPTLLGAVGGFLLGFSSWNALYLSTLATAPVVWLPKQLGHAGALLLQLALLGALAAYLIRFVPASAPSRAQSLPALFDRIFVERWPAWCGGLAIGALGVVAYFRTSPLGVTAELGSRARTLGDTFHLLPERLEGLDGFAGCATRIIDTAMTPNGLFVLALVAGALAAGVAANQFRPQPVSLKKLIAAIVGGILMGWAAMVGLGCTIGVLLSGISAGALSGWLFGVAVAAGVWFTLPLRRRWLETA